MGFHISDSLKFFTVHGVIVIAIVYMTVVEGFRPSWRSLPRTIVITDLCWFLCWIVNNQIGSNYLYTQGKLPTPSLSEYLNPWPWYLLSMQGLGMVLCVLLYLPFAIQDGLKGKNLEAAVQAMATVQIKETYRIWSTT